MRVVLSPASGSVKPDAPLLRVNLGQTLIALPDNDKIDEGIGELKKSLVQDEENSAAWRLLAEAYDRRGQDGLARYATAEYNFQEGDKRQALIFAVRGPVAEAAFRTALAEGNA